MATIILSSVGSLFGPVGQIVGTLAGSAIDSALFAPKDIEGARLKELAVSGSSYGSPIARQYGTMRVPGTVIWATDFQEHRDKQGNGKGKPKTVTYSYSVSLAVALSSRPIDRIGRVWADGNLLRGAAGDLKSGGTMRLYTGRHDQPRDPLLAAELGDRCPAFRGTAYAVFEDLDLTDFGNRIPSLSFEVVAGDAADLLGAILGEAGSHPGSATRFPELSGFGHEGGSLGDVARLVDKLHPLAIHSDGEHIGLSTPTSDDQAPMALSPPASWDDGDFGRQGGLARSRSDRGSSPIRALRYYDPDRDYQPGIQHADNAEGNARTFQFPGAFAADDARSLARRANVRAAVTRDALLWRCAELDPAIKPGSLVTAPGVPGVYLVSAWEWRERGVELELTRFRGTKDAPGNADPGSAWKPRDRLPAETTLRVFETPWDGTGSSGSRIVYAAASAASGRWSGCALYALRDEALLPLGQSATTRAVTGTLATSLAPSIAIRFERGATFQLQLVNEDADLFSTDLGGIAQGDNRLLVGHEVLQFESATPLGSGLWQISGLLRGRGATEAVAMAGHEAGTIATLLDDRLVPLSEAPPALGASTFAAIGLWDEGPVVATLENVGATLIPPTPVHARRSTLGDGAVSLSWVRRARGQWHWSDSVDVPLIEEVERYEVGFGPADAPFAQWTVDTRHLEIPPAQVATLLASHGDASFWVRQSGSYAASTGVLFETIP